ncbi:aspartyl protease family protein [soil metagenome]
MCLFAGLSARAGEVAEIPFEYRDGFLWLKVNVAEQGKPLNFVFDTGAASSVLDLGTARRLAVKLSGRVAVQGVHSRTTARRVDRFSAKAAGIAMPESLIAVDLCAISKTCHCPIDGLIGADFFRDRVVQIDFSVGKIRILDKVESMSHCVVLPMKSQNGIFCVPVGIAGNPSRWMRVDTGCDSALEWALNRNAKEVNSGTSIGLTSARSRIISTDVRLGDHIVTGVKTGVHDRQMFPGEAGLVGNGLLSRFCVTIDVPGARLLLESK